MRTFPRIHIPLLEPEGVIPHLGKPSHWKQGRSAKALADCWHTANTVPESVRAVLDQSDVLRGAELIDAHLERKTDLRDSRGSPSQTDLLAILGVGDALAVLGVEAKVTETFGDFVGTWLDGGAGKKDRLEQLCYRLGFSEDAAKPLRYQLLHRTVATLLEAGRYRASRAVMLVQSFCPDSSGLLDYVAFGKAMGFERLGAGLLSEEKQVGDIVLQLGWAGDSPPEQKRPHRTVEWLNEFGRTRLSRNFFMRDFLHSEIASIHGLANAPDDPKLAVEAGRRLCEELLEPIQETFGPIAIRSAYRSSEVNGFGSRMQRLKERGYSCASNEGNFARHIWDVRDGEGCMGATACIIVPSVWDRFGHEPGGWQRLAWWIHEHLPYSHLEFYPKFWAFNIGWHERPERRIDSYADPLGCLTRSGNANHSESHADAWRPLLEAQATPIRPAGVK